MKSPTLTGQASASAASSASRRLFLEPPPVNSSTLAATPTPGMKRSRSASGSPNEDLGLCLSVASGSSTPASSPTTVQDGIGATAGAGSVAAGGDKKVGSIVGDLEVIEAIASKQLPKDDDVANSDDEVEGPHADDLYYGMDM
ncbi:unnamed protein product [Urochloa humidicola]